MFQFFTVNLRNIGYVNNVLWLKLILFCYAINMGNIGQLHLMLPFVLLWREMCLQAFQAQTWRVNSAGGQSGFTKLDESRNLMIFEH